jgi:conjugal transfer ATP-binding protein TraC
MFNIEESLSKVKSEIVNRLVKSEVKDGFGSGLQDEIDLISYSSFEENADHILIDGIYMRCLFISGYPFSASSGWLNPIINFNHDIDVSYQLHEIEANTSLPKLTRKITELESTKRAMVRNGQIIGPEITDPLESAKDLRDKIQRGQEKLFQVGIYVCLRAKTIDELNKTTRIIESSLSARLFSIKVSMYRQTKALQSILPRAHDLLNQKRNLDSSSAALTFPFISSELVEESGILYGINKSNSSLVIMDRFKLNNANSIVFAESGSGKSYATKVEILRHIIQGTNIIVIDPEREYEKLCKSVDGTYIKLSAKSKQKINPFDLSTTSHTKETLVEHIQDLMEIISIMAEGLSTREKSATDKALLMLFKSHRKSTPLLEDLYEGLHNLGQINLCERLEKFISGSLAGVFNQQTNIELDNRLIVFDIKDLPESLRRIMMMILSNFVQNKVKLKPEKRLLVIDEGWILLQNEESARFIAGLVRRARKYYLGVTFITQVANDFLSNDYGRAIASQSSLRILMRQDSTTINKVSKEFNLSEFEQSFLLTSERGEALLIADQNHVAVKIISSEAEHPLITTNPSEIY